jgi:small-conductance mechanosensitive channel
MLQSEWIKGRGCLADETRFQRGTAMCNQTSRKGGRAPGPLQSALRGPGLGLFALLLFVAVAGGQTPPTSGTPTAPATATVSGASEPISGQAVVFGDHILFHVRVRLGPFSARERAAEASRRIADLSRAAFSGPVRLTVEDSETASDLVAGGHVIATVTDADAAASHLPRHALAAGYARVIEEAVNAARERYSVKSLLLAVFFALLATAVLILVLFGLGRLFPALTSKLETWRGTIIRSVRIQRLELLTADRITDVLVALARFTRVVLVVVAFGIYIPLLLSFFPWTSGLSRTLLGYVVTPFGVLGHTVVDYLPKLFFLLVILVVTYYFIKVVRLFFREIERGTVTFPNFEREWARPTYKIVRFLVIAFAAVMAFPYLPGSSSPAFRGVGLFLGLLFSLASSSAIANVVAGVILTYTGAFRLGDRVKIADTVGDVTEKTLLVTRVRTIKNVEVTIPNSMVLGSHIVNYSASAQEEGLILHTAVTIGYDAPWKKVHELLIAAARATADVADKPEPFVLQTSLNDFFVTYEINAYTRIPNRMAQIYSDLHQNIQDRFNEAGVEIMSPHFTSVRDGNDPAMPETPGAPPRKKRGFRLLPIPGLPETGSPGSRNPVER